jgi:lipoprotein-anchoring transpeptidase ErfK/SrfK
VKPLIPLVVILLLSGASAAQADALRLEVDLSERQLVATLGDEELQRYDVAVGKPKHPTPEGTFSIRKVIWNPHWVPPAEKWAKGKKAKTPYDEDNPMQAVKIFFKEPDYYIHGTPDTDSLGSAASHGCIRMDPDDARELAKLVMEHGGKPMPEPWYRRIFRRKTTQVVHLTEPVRMAITE